MRAQHHIRQINGAINSADQLIFVYMKEDGDEVMRFVTPIELIEDPVKGDKITCIQHMPTAGVRSFFVKNIIKMHRVIDRNIVNPSDYNEYKLVESAGKADNTY